jgi:hypothetical protein
MTEEGMDLRAARHPVKVWSWYVRAAKVSKRPVWKGQYETVFLAKMSRLGKIVVRMMSIFV